jgi:DedD protein
MSWQPNGRYYQFSPDVIRACVPPASGVYGLFNFRYQLLIGESDNICEALLGHYDESDKLSWRYRPTRFTFQLCPVEERERKAAELIETYQPVRQSGTAQPEALSENAEPAPRESPAGELDAGPIDLEEFTMHEREEPATARPRYYFERAQGIALLVLFSVCMIASFYLGVLTGEKLERQANLERDKALAWAPAATSAPTTVTVEPSEPKVDAPETAEGVSVHIPGWTAKAEGPSTPAKTESQPTPSSAAAQQAGTTLARDSAATAPTSQRESSGKWSVQIAAAPAQDVADALADRLASAGYESYVVQANVKGQTFYRVRVGPLEAQDKAESVRQTLARQERYRDAFLVNE